VIKHPTRSCLRRYFEHARRLWDQMHATFGLRVIKSAFVKPFAKELLREKETCSEAITKILYCGIMVTLRR
jgi:hypothetical protein